MNVPSSAWDNSRFFRIAGWCSLAQSALYVAAVAALSRTPLLKLFDMERDSGMEAFMAHYAANPWPIRAMCLAFIFLGLLGFIAVAPATFHFLKGRDRGWLSPGWRLGMLCLAVITAYYIWFLAALPARAALWRGSDPAVRSLLAGFSNPQEPAAWMSWFMFAGMGLWVLAVGDAARRHPALSGAFPVACLVKAGGFWLAHAGIVLQAAPLAAAGAILGGLIGGPAYHALLGNAFRRSITDSTTKARRK
ncbi:MAG: hypothetical protein AB1921_15865 [Thermodesulfobacteriota bacterium]